MIQQKVSRGLDPPQVLSPDMIPPSERGTPGPVSPHCSALVPFSCAPPGGAGCPQASWAHRSPDSAGPSFQDSASTLGPGELTGVAELDDISQEIAQLQRYVHGDPLPRLPEVTCTTLKTAHYSGAQPHGVQRG